MATVTWFKDMHMALVRSIMASETQFWGFCTVEKADASTGLVCDDMSLKLQENHLIGPEMKSVLQNS